MPFCCLPLWQLHGGARLPHPQASVSPAKVVPVLVWRLLGAGPGGSGLAAFHSAEETLLAWVGWLSLLGVLPAQPRSLGARSRSKLQALGFYNNVDT